MDRYLAINARVTERQYENDRNTVLPSALDRQLADDKADARRYKGVTFAALKGPIWVPSRAVTRRTAQVQTRIRQAAFSLRCDARRNTTSKSRPQALKQSVSDAVDGVEHEDDDDDYDDEDDDGVAFLQWQMPSTPLNAEPVSDEDEQYQFDTITAGNVPALFLGKAYTNAAVNVVGMHKMQKLVEDMYYHLVAPKPDQEAISTIGLLLRLCWMPHPHRSHTATTLYADTSTAVMDRGLDLNSHDIALKSIANTHATADSTQATSSSMPQGATDTSAGTPDTPSTQAPRLPPLRPPLPPEGMQTLLSSCSRISGILLGLSSAVRDASPSTNDPEESGDDSARRAPAAAEAGSESRGRDAPKRRTTATSTAETPASGTNANHDASGAARAPQAAAPGEPARPSAHATRTASAAADERGTRTADGGDGRHAASGEAAQHSSAAHADGRRGEVAAGQQASQAEDGGPTTAGHAAGTAFEAVVDSRAPPPPLLPGAMSAHASEAAEALSQHVRATAARLSAALDQMARLLAPTAVPLALAVLCAQVLPSSMQFKASPADQIALEHFAATPAGEAFREQFDANIAAPAAALAGCCGAAARSTRDDTDTTAAADGGGETAGDDPEEGGRLFQPLKWLRGRRGEGLAEGRAAESAAEEVAWPGKGAAAVEQLPVFFVPGVSLSLPLQGHAVQFWPVFLSRMHLTTWVSQTHHALAAVWLARRRARRERVASAAKARVARFFAWCRAASRADGGRGRGRGAAADAADGDDDGDPAGEEPAEAQELMEELSAGSGLDGVGGGDSLVISISPSGFGKSVEYVALGAAALLTGIVEGAAAAVDTAALAMPGAKRMLGLCPEFEVQAARLGEVAAAARAWNGVAAPFAADAMQARRDALEQEVDNILAALTQALTDAARAAGDASATTAASAGTPSGRTSVRIRVTTHDSGQEGIPGTGGPPSGPGRSARTDTEQAARASTSPGSDQRDSTHSMRSAGGDARPDEGADDTQKQGGAGGAAVPAARDGGAVHGNARDGPSAGEPMRRRWYMPWRRQRQSGDGGSAPPAAADAAADGAAPLPAGGHPAARAEGGGARDADGACCAAAGDHGTQHAAQNAEGDSSAPERNGSAAGVTGTEEGEGGRGPVLPAGVAEQFREVLRRVVTGVAADVRVAVRDGTQAAAPDALGHSVDGEAGGGSAGSAGSGAADGAAARPEVAQAGGSEEARADAAQVAQVASLRSGAEADDMAGAQIAEERAAALAAASGSAPLHERLSDFLGAAIAERRALVENMLATRRSALRGDVSSGTLRELRAAERRSRVSLMHTLHAMGDELAAAAGDVDAHALRTMWLTTVNSLLAIDQASGLSPLLPATSGSAVRVPQLRTAPATLDFLLAAAASMQAAARRAPRTFSLFLDPAASLLQASRSHTLHAALLRSATTDAASAPAQHRPDGGPGVGAALAGELEPQPEKLWRFTFDAVMPAVSRLDAHSHVTLEVDLDQALGAAPPEMLCPRLAQVSAAPPFSRPDFRGVLLIGDLDGPHATPGRAGAPGGPANFEAHLGHLT